MLLGAVNYFGVRTGNVFQTMLTLVKVVALVGIIATAFILHPIRPRFVPVIAGISSPIATFGVAMIAVQWAYIGWEYVAFAAGEIRRPSRNLPLALILGTGVLTTLYVLVNLAYFVALPVGRMEGVLRIAEQAMDALVGSGGATLVVLAVILSTFGCNASSIIPMSRVCFAMAEDRLFFRSAAAIHPRFRTPHVAILLTCGWSALLTLTGTYEQLYTYVVFTALLFYAAGGMAIIRLRIRKPEVARPYRCWGYPVTPLIFVISTLALVVSTLMERPVESFIGLAIVAAGLPVYLRRRSAGSG
jgi:APA family basic amino acid/polyamine antiporter